jgi:ABC-2 type transport system permease protein
MATQATTLARPMAPASAGMMLPGFTLWWREIVRFYRQPTRVVGVLASHLVFWLVIGSGYGTSFRSGGGPGQKHYLMIFIGILSHCFSFDLHRMSVIEILRKLLSPCSAPAPTFARQSPQWYQRRPCRGLIFLLFAPSPGVHWDCSSSAGAG